MSEADKNHKFKGVFLNNSFETAKIDNVNSFLEKESKNNKTESWNRLDKTMKIKKLSAYVDDVVTLENSLSETEAGDLKRYLIDSLDKKKLQHVKDVCCDKVTGDIVSIPTLHFTSNIRKFTLKRSEKRVSTLKSLGKGKKPALAAAMPAAMPVAI